MTNIAVLIACVAAVEGNPSGGYSDTGYSYGPLCCTKGAVSDVNRRYGLHYKWPQDCGSLRVSTDIFLKYTSRGKNYEERCRIWNGGYRGRNRKAPRDYAKRVMNLFNEEMKRASSLQNHTAY